MSSIKLIVGLGNPEEKYHPTRHNAGAWFVEKLADEYGVSFKEENKFFAKTARVSIDGQDVRFLLPTTFMNLSGKAVGAIAKFYRIAPEEILVAHDELDLPTGVAKIKLGGGHGGHNGLRDIMASLGNQQNFYRLRIGISRPLSKANVASFVLTPPSPSEFTNIQFAINHALRCIPLIYRQGIANATTAINSFKA